MKTEIVTLCGQTVRIWTKKWKYLTNVVKHSNDLLSSTIFLFIIQETIFSSLLINKKVTILPICWKTDKRDNNLFGSFQTTEVLYWKIIILQKII